ncbi:hypothetical protein HYDPIDRAFT_89235 [Hydnomerulius pinastri MD-312]|uniref:Uncharacterized protein n=1 Tax=Hydnomerulius pinastri MD-312 TaxID=994086 RepID=A0A0C9WAS3_9AGAM|nr:hypothetical protein HYDPIDRAFT_89235 [Hydnomerulius pinastri MD-312]
MYRQQQSASSSPMSSANPSPSSSPAFGPVDSSPLSSPHLAPYSLDSSPLTSTSLSHPFAASTKAIKRPPNYEKKADTPPSTPPGTFSRSLGLYRNAGCSRSLQENDYMDSGSTITGSPPHRTSRYIDREERLWEDALRKPFDTGNGYIDLSNQQLKSIPASIGDLSSFFVTPELSEHTLFSGRSFTRVNTAPAVESSRTRSFERTQSIKDSGKERHVLQLYLVGNSITSLPPQLFTVQNITVLSLRKNRLTFIPSDICRLTNLRELNVSGNQLTFLPWEMRDMKIDNLMLHPNPFLSEPSCPAAHLGDLGSSRPSLRPRRSITRLHSLRKEAESSTPKAPTLSVVTYSLPRIPPLTEICLRLLLAPLEKSENHLVIAEYYGVPLSEHWNIPPNVRHTLMECVPGILRPRKRFSVDTITLEDQAPSQTGTSTCPNPQHKGRVFVKHASERFSWERRIAGADVGGAVPLRWRGCLRTCLNFLDFAEPRPTNEIKKPSLGVDRSTAMDVDMDQAVQAVDLGSAGLDFD